jgi:acetyl esterase
MIPRSTAQEHKLVQPPAADADMQQVLDAFAGLGPKPIASLTPAQARQQPSPADAVKAVLRAKGIADAGEPGVTIQEMTYPGAAGPQKARIYLPAGISSAKPVLVFFRGGGWVIANLDIYEATPISLAKQLQAVVISIDYRMGPEHKFPAAHDDAIAAYRWVRTNASLWGGDVTRIAVAGESAGGNLAAYVAIAARDQGLPMPVHQLLVYPVASTATDSPSYHDCADAKPLNAAMMGWFVKNATNGNSDLKDPRLNLIAANLRGLPPTTIVSAEIDPLRSDSDLLAEALTAAGVPVEHRLYRGATHEFFGMAAVVSKAREAQAFAVQRLAVAFTKP